MRIEQFENIEAWQKAKSLTVLIYSVFENNRDYGFRDQIQRASVSVMNNIAKDSKERETKNFQNFYLLQKDPVGKCDQCCI